MIITNPETGHEIIVPDDFTPITIDEAIFGMQRAVEQQGEDYIDNSKVFAEKGITDPYTMESLNDAGTVWDVESIYPGLFADLDATNVLAMAQNYQDVGRPWGVAFNAAADEYMLRADGVDPRC